MMLSDEILNARIDYETTWSQLPTHCALNHEAFAEAILLTQQRYSVMSGDALHVFGMDVVEVDGDRRVFVYSDRSKLRQLPRQEPARPLYRRAFALGGEL